MKPYRKATLLVILMLLLALAFVMQPERASAQGPGPGDKIIFGSAFTLARGQRLDGDLVVVGGAVEVEQDAVVEGDVAIIGGSTRIDGVVNGDVVTLGGVIHLGPHAVVNGDATAVGGVIEREPGAQVLGNIVETQGREMGGVQITPVPGPHRWTFPFQEAASTPGPLSWLGRALLQGLATITWTALLAAMGVFLILLAPAPTERVARGIQNNPLLAFAVGFGASLLAFIVAFILSVTICLLPLSLALMLGWVAALLFGWLALGWLLGRELMRGLKSENATPIWEAVAGVALLTLMWKLPDIVPYVGGLASFLVMFVAGNIAIGGVLLTRFGSRDYPAGPAAPAPPLPSPEDALPERSQVPPADPLIPPPSAE
ncbi:MAG TPA: hypothetical protein EYH29_03280 [Caldilineales bacterium]|nr:hypothetical protein [Caldilineales bacterium]